MYIYIINIYVCVDYINSWFKTTTIVSVKLFSRISEQSRLYNVAMSLLADYLYIYVNNTSRWIECGGSGHEVRVTVSAVLGSTIRFLPSLSFSLRMYHRLSCYLTWPLSNEGQLGVTVSHSSVHSVSPSSRFSTANLRLYASLSVAIWKEKGINAHVAEKSRVTGYVRSRCSSNWKFRDI